MDDPEEPLVPEEPPVPEEPLVVRPVPIVCQTIAQVHKIRSWKVAEALAREGSLEIHSDANDYPVLVVPRTYLPIRPHDGPVPGQASPREHEGPDVESRPTCALSTAVVIGANGPSSPANIGPGLSACGRSPATCAA